MSHLQKALQIWLQSGYNQAQFSKITGIEQSLCSRIFAGTRGFTDTQRNAVFNGFKDLDMQQGLILLKADLEDSIPDEARALLRLVIDIPARTRETAPDKSNRVEEARKRLIAELEAKDPSVLSMALALHDWRTH